MPSGPFNAILPVLHEDVAALSCKGRCGLRKKRRPNACECTCWRHAPVSEFHFALQPLHTACEDG